MEAAGSRLTLFDPSQAVPDEYDVFCETCGYSLAGLSGDRCPECGQAFDPKQLPFARIPWLHRRRLGRWRAYWSTVRMVMFSPARFASELCRPVRISAEDARRFRSTTIWLATICCGLAAVANLYLAIASRGPWVGPLDIAAEAAIVAVAIVAFHILLRLATDMPLFIWKGLPALPPHALAPVHHYASAPIAAAAFIGPLFGAMIWAQGVAAQMRADAVVGLLLLVEGLLVLGWAAWLWVVALVLMRTATGAGRGRVALLGLYLPAHWLTMLLMMSMAFAASLFAGGTALEWIARAFGASFRF